MQKNGFFVQNCAVATYVLAICSHTSGPRMLVEVSADSSWCIAYYLPSQLCCGINTVACKGLERGKRENGHRTDYALGCKMSQRKNMSPEKNYMLCLDPKVNLGQKNLKKMVQQNSVQAKTWISDCAPPRLLVAEFGTTPLKIKVGFGPNLSSLKV